MDEENKEAGEQHPTIEADDSTAGIAAKPPAFQRRPPWKSTLDAMAYVQKISKSEDINIRNTDRITSIILLVSSILAILSMVLAPISDFRPLAITMCDILFGVTLIVYSTNRFGILTALTPRQALITWELVVAAGFMGTYLTLNFGAIIALYFARGTH
jgi:hypothetical protein